MAEGSFSFTNNITGIGANVAQGQNVTQTVTQNFGGGGNLYELLSKLATDAKEKQVPPEVVAEVEKLAVESQVVEEQAVETSVKKKVYDRVAKILPTLGKFGLAVALKGAENFAKSNWIAATILEAYKDATNAP